jgi:uncharacterized FlaG/YvyC family protein
LTSINGVDPVIVNIVKTPTQKPALIETQKIKISDDKKGRKDKQEQKDSARHPKQELAAAIDKINKLLEVNQISLYFQIVNNENHIRVQLISLKDKNIVVEMLPEKVINLAAEFHTKGFTIDNLI